MKAGVIPPPAQTAFAMTSKQRMLKCSFEKNFRHSDGRKSTWQCIVKVCGIPPPIQTAFAMTSKQRMLKCSFEKNFRHSDVTLHNPA